MATFSQQFLSNLGNPTGMLAGATQLGQALGSAPGIIVEGQKAKQKKEEEAQINKDYAAAVRANSAKKLYELSNQATTQGKPELAQQLFDKAQEVEQKVETQENFVDRKVSLANTAQRLKKPDLAQRIITIDDPAELKTIASELRKIEFDGESLKDDYILFGNNAYNVKTKSFLTPPQAAKNLKISELTNLVTEKSLLEYLKTKDVNVLRFKSDDPDTTETEEEQNLLVATLKGIDRKLETSDKALGMEGKYWQVTYPLAQFLPLTDAKQLSNYVSTLQANLAFDRLQEMRNASKTGGALGQVSNIELGLLKDSVAALDPSSKDFFQQLKVVRRSYENFKNALLGNPPTGENYVRHEGRLYYYDSSGDVIDLGAVAEKKARQKNKE